jgi:hypothetical protein
MRYRERLAVEKVDQKSWIDGSTDFGGRVDPPFVRNIQLGGWSIPCSLYNQTNLKQG